MRVLCPESPCQTLPFLTNVTKRQACAEKDSQPCPAPALNLKLLEDFPWHLPEYRVALAVLDPEFQSRQAVSETANRRPIPIDILVLCNLSLHQLPQAQRHIAHTSCTLNLSSHALSHNDQRPASLKSGESRAFFTILVRTWTPKATWTCTQTL